MSRLPPRVPGQATATGARQAFGGSDTGRVRNASPVRGGRPGTPLSAAAQADPCSCCRCQRITTGTVTSDDLDEFGRVNVLSALNCGCTPLDGGSIVATPWVFVDGLLHTSSSWDPGTPDENGDYYCQLWLENLPGSGPWTWAWLWETSSDCWTLPT